MMTDPEEKKKKGLLLAVSKEATCEILTVREKNTACFLNGFREWKMRRMEND